MKLRDKITLKSIEGLIRRKNDTFTTISLLIFPIIKGVSVSKFEDGFVVFHVKKIANGETKTPDTYPKVREGLKNTT